MKYNLKNRPPLKHTEDNSLLKFELYFDQTEKWFEGFEEELFGKLKNYYSTSETAELIREILGDVIVSAKKKEKKKK